MARLRAAYGHIEARQSGFDVMKRRSDAMSEFSTSDGNEGYKVRDDVFHVKH